LPTKLETYFSGVKQSTGQWLGDIKQWTVEWSLTTETWQQTETPRDAT